MTDSEVKAYDLSHYQRLVSVEGDRIRGKFAVLLPVRSPNRAWVTAHDVTIYDEHRHSGRLLYSNHLTGSVTDGVPLLNEHMVASDRLADVQEVWDEMLAALVAAVNAAVGSR